MKIKNKTLVKIKNKFTITLMILIVIIASFMTDNVVNADDSSSQYLNNVNYNIQVNTDGSMDVEEIWNINIEYTNTLFKDFKIDKTKYTSITNCKVSELVNGEEKELTNCEQYYYHVPTNEYYFLIQDGNYEVAWGTGLENGTATKTYSIKYHVNDAIAKYNDCSELYWQAFGSEFGIAIKKITGTIKLPFNATSKDEIKVWGHTPDLNGTINVTDLDTVSFEINDNKAEKMVELRVAMPTNMIETSGRTYKTDELQKIISEETSWANSANATRIGKIIIVAIILGVVFAWLIFVLIKNILVIRKTKKIVPTEHFDYFRELPNKDETPLEARFIIDKGYLVLKSNALGPVLMATILNLSLKKVLKIDKTVGIFGKDEYTITLQESEVANFTQDEEKVIELIKRASHEKGTVTMKELRNYIETNTDTIQKVKMIFEDIASTKLLNNHIISQDNIDKKNALWFNKLSYGIVIAMIFLFFWSPALFTSIGSAIGISYSMIGAIIVFIIIDGIIGKIADKKITPYTQKGIDEMDKWIAFKKYMEDFSMLDKREIPEIALWEKYLVYATAFGIADKVIKQLKIVYPEYYSNSEFMSNYIMMDIMLNTNFYSSFNSISTATSMSFSSGSGAGGGFSGGGGGGGGRRRWRRKITSSPIYINIIFI